MHMHEDNSSVSVFWQWLAKQSINWYKTMFDTQRTPTLRMSTCGKKSADNYI